MELLPYLRAVAVVPLHLGQDGGGSDDAFDVPVERKLRREGPGSHPTVAASQSQATAELRKESRSGNVRACVRACRRGGAPRLHEHDVVGCIRELVHVRRLAVWDAELQHDLPYGDAACVGTLCGTLCTFTRVVGVGWERRLPWRDGTLCRCDHRVQVAVA